MEQLLITAFSGLFVGLLGYMIKYKDKTELIAGFKEEKFSDVEGLKDFVGFYMFVVAGLTISVGVADYLSLLERGLHWTVYSVLLTATVLRMLIGVRDFR